MSGDSPFKMNNSGELDQTTCAVLASLVIRLGGRVELSHGEFDKWFDLSVEYLPDRETFYLQASRTPDVVCPLLTEGGKLDA